MLTFSIVLGLAALCVDLVSSSTGPACSQEPYKALLFLSAVPAAESFCSSKFPLPACTSTINSTVTSVIPAATTVTAATVETTVSTLLTTTTTGTTTLDVTTSTFITDATTTTSIVVVTTTTTTVTSVPMKKRHAEVTEATTLQTVAKRGNPVSSILSSLESEAKSVIQTACSCIEALPSCGTTTATIVVSTTSTSTISVNATDSVTATSVIDVEATATSTITEIDTTTTTATTTESVATTQTSTVCASVSVPSNGNFETGSLSPWVKAASATVPINIVAGGYPGGSKFTLQATPMSNAALFEIYQRLTTCPGVKYTCSYSWNYQLFLDVSNHVPFVEVYINDENVDETDFDEDTAGFWNTDEFTFTGTGDDYMYVIAESPGSTVNTLELDNFVCKYS